MRSIISLCLQQFPRFRPRELLSIQKFCVCPQPVFVKVVCLFPALIFNLVSSPILFPALLFQSGVSVSRHNPSKLCWFPTILFPTIIFHSSVFVSNPTIPKLSVCLHPQVLKVFFFIALVFLNVCLFIALVFLNVCLFIAQFFQSLFPAKSSIIVCLFPALILLSLVFFSSLNVPKLCVYFQP